MIKAIIFDLGNVVVKFDETPHFKKWASCGTKSFEEVKDYYKNSSARMSFERGEITPNQFYEKYVRDLNLKISYKDFARNYCDIFSRNKEVENIIKSLKGKYRLILLSNTNILQYEFVKKKYKILEMFDYYVLSYEAGMRKPNPFIFLEAVKKSKTFPWNCAYFDDIQKFTRIARLIGIKAFQFVGAKKLREDLKKVL